MSEGLCLNYTGINIDNRNTNLFICNSKHILMNLIRTKTILTFTVIMLLFACSQSKYVSFNVTQPAEITFPSDVNTVLLIDRTKFDNKALNTIEGILTGELPADDRYAAQELLSRLKNTLDASPRFK